MNEQAPSKERGCYVMDGATYTSHADGSETSRKATDEEVLLADALLRATDELRGCSRELAIERRARSLADRHPNSNGTDAGSNPAGRSTHEPPASLWGDGTREMLIQLRDWLKSKMPCPAGDCCNELRGWVEKVDQHITFHAPAASAPPPVPEWQRIETAPKDGTCVDLFVDDERWPDCVWGLPNHSCGEDEGYCDSDWHSLEEGWVFTTLNMAIEASPSHWMLPPSGPTKEGGQ